MDLTKFDESGNAIDDEVRTRIDNWRKELFDRDRKRCDTWTTLAELDEDIRLSVEVSDGEYVLRQFECIMPINQIDICKFLKKEPEDLTKEDIENYAEELWSGDACWFFDKEHEEELKALAWEELEKEQEIWSGKVHIVFVERENDYEPEEYVETHWNWGA